MNSAKNENKWTKGVIIVVILGIIYFVGKETNYVQRHLDHKRCMEYIKAFNIINKDRSLSVEICDKYIMEYK